MGSGIFKSSDPARMASAIVEATAHFTDPEHVAKVSRGLGEAMRGLDESQLRRAPRRPGVVAGGGALIGVLDLQGDVREHLAALEEVGARRPAGEGPRGPRGHRRSRAAGRRVDDAVHAAGVDRPVRARWRRGSAARRPAGVRHLRRPDPRGARGARRPAGPAHLRRARRRRPPQRLRAPGQSFEADVVFGSGEGPALPAVFIRAPLIVSVGRRGRGAGGARRRAGAGAPGRRAGVVLPPRAHARPPGPPAVRRDVRGRAPMRAARRASSGRRRPRQIRAPLHPHRHLPGPGRHRGRRHRAHRGARRLGPRGGPARRPRLGTLLPPHRDRRRLAPGRVRARRAGRRLRARRRPSSTWSGT